MAGHAKFREQRQRAFWAPRYDAARTGASLLDVAVEHLRAAIADVADEQRDEAARMAAADIREIAELLTHGQVHMRSSHRLFTRFRRPTRRRDAGARARGQLNTA